MRLVCVTNIPSPYRLHELELLNKELQARGIEFETIFMANSESRRHWTFRQEDWSFRSWVASGIHPRVGSSTLHANPGIAAHLCHNPPTWLVLGGSWHMPTVACLIALVRSRILSPYLLFWTEATLSNARFSRKGIPHCIKAKIFAKFDAFVVPGQNSVAYLDELLPGTRKRLLRFANFVDYEAYTRQVLTNRKKKEAIRQRYGIDNEIVFLWPARLAPEKGIIEFLTAIAGYPAKDYRILLVGDGPMQGPIRSFLEKKNMNQVIMLGHKGISEILELYACADLLLLPSLREPYGFVAVEALYAGLPLLLSKNVGALPEVLISGKNGWSFDPYNKTQILNSLRNVLAAGRNGLAEMGERSREIALGKFNGPKACKEFVDNLLTTLPPKKTDELLSRID